METRLMETKRKQRSDTGPRLTERDLSTLRIIGEQYALRFDQLQSLLGSHAKAETKIPGILSESATRHTIDRWEAAGLAEYKKILADTPGFCWLTTNGLHATSLPFRKYEPSPSQLDHIYWSAQARLKITHEHKEWTWQSERWLRTQLDQKVKSVKLPDALLHLPDARTVAIEIELTQKTATVLEQIIKDRALVYLQTWYFAAPKTQQALNTAIFKLDQLYQQRVRIHSLDILTTK
jgi:hypothetical protein